jgi:hypothetical protein
MNNNLVVVIIASALLVACGKNTDRLDQSLDASKIYIMTTDRKGAHEKEVKTEVITALEDEYFEISLYSTKEGPYYIAKWEIEAPTSVEDFRYRFLNIIQPTDSSVMRFDGSTDFLNFMAKGGYEMVDQRTDKYATHYTFKRK